MSISHKLIGTLATGLLLLGSARQQDAQTERAPAVVVGTFDSRAVAMAWVRSAEFSKDLEAKFAELERARESGDEKTVARLEALGPQLQERIHGQGFGAAPVDDILVRVEERLAGVAQAAGVDVIVSKWTLAYQAPSARFVDVTDRMAALFDPDEETLKVIRELLATDPVPLDQLGDH